ncbi:MAG: HD domain-containing protein [Candidatus Gracilibacteria bacterium]|nr:HD domain-containing protein [Candidatus Gracilibacteria bacterium]
MIGHYINLIFRGTSIIRWNNFPRTENVSTTDNLAFVLHISLLLSGILKEKEGIEIDELYIFKKLIFGSFNTLILSDINSDVKSRIRLKNPKISDELDDKTFQFMYGIKVPDSIRYELKFINDNKNNPKYKIEHDLLTFSKRVSVCYEVLANSKIHSDVYENILISIRKELDNPDFKMFLKYVNPSSETSNDFEKYLLNIRRLQSNYRWNMHKKIYPISVMSHLYITFFLLYVIGKIEEKTEKEMLELLKIAIFHDIPEAITGDIVGPTKRAVPGLEELIAEVETDMLDEYFLVYLDGLKFKDDFKRYMLKPWEGENGKLAKMADIFSSLFESKLEVRYDDKFAKIYKDTKRKLHGYKYKSADYLLKYGVDYFDDNMEDIIKL